ncbi:HNH endonuclease [Vibrio crassostreae]|uniref:hypothetical protein n=1 Tax=Vibrio crassostreae TaxID=246167 RepID=UPI00105194B9|nr:hypothetical protein [Vibrio crassostreae]TCT98890.1 hypothetical protein EDB47_12864 [Vibrio crassostreae]CAK2324604.1 HNH endonuclease [Vibrio crassostreae]CAK2970800.1 HNH endonuclease [Vibrio crassostreae]CAK3005237.1 HNH endonuclease [Vibrio crassostreae]CAK3714160.1 HNH endonuclease [Vibrio crassostreae]
MKVIENNTLRECVVCKQPTLTMVENGHQAKRYSLCEKHHSQIEYVRVIQVIQQSKFKRDGKTRKNVKIVDPRKSLVRFDFYFRELALEDCGNYIWLGAKNGPSVQAVHVYPDKSDVTDYLLANPPFNAKGIQYRTIRKINVWDRGDRNEIHLSNIPEHHYTKKGMSLNDAYAILVRRKAVVIQKVGAKKVVTKSA